MHTLLRLYARLLEIIGAIEKSFGVFLIALIVVTITVQVFTRYVFDRPIVWVEELATYAFIWGAFIGAALGHKQQRHIRIDTFVGRLSPEKRLPWFEKIWREAAKGREASLILVGSGPERVEEDARVRVLPPTDDTAGA